MKITLQRTKWFKKVFCSRGTINYVDVDSLRDKSQMDAKVW